MAALRLILFGGFQVVSCSGTPISIGVKKAKALLAYLALHPGQACSREKLATLLWGESGEAQARHSLRQALASLRKALSSVDSPVLIAESDTLKMAPQALGVDVFDFEQLISGAGYRALSGRISGGVQPSSGSLRGLADGGAEPFTGMRSGDYGQAVEALLSFGGD